MTPRGVRVAIAVGAVAMIAAGTASGPGQSGALTGAWGEDHERRHGWYEGDGEAPHGFLQRHDSMPHYGVSRFELHDY